MEPLDLRRAPPRPPRDALLGVTMLPRTIDKLRAALPGGELGAYHVRGLAAMLFEHFGCDLQRAIAAVRDAGDEATAARAIVADAPPASIAAWNERVATYEPFVRDRERATNSFPFATDRPDPRYAIDLIAEDDARIFPGIPPAS